MRERHMNNEGHIREVLILENPKELEKSQFLVENYLSFRSKVCQVDYVHLEADL